MRAECFLSFHSVITMIMSLHIISPTFSVFLSLNIVIKSPLWLFKEVGIRRVQH